MRARLANHRGVITGAVCTHLSELGWDVACRFGILLMKERDRGGDITWSIWPWNINNHKDDGASRGKKNQFRERVRERAEGMLTWLWFHFHIDHQGLDGCTRARLQMCQGVFFYCKWPETSNPAEGEHLAMRLLCLWDVQFSFDWSILKSKSAKLPT